MILLYSDELMYEFGPLSNYACALRNMYRRRDFHIPTVLKFYDWVYAICWQKLFLALLLLSFNKLKRTSPDFDIFKHGALKASMLDSTSVRDIVIPSSTIPSVWDILFKRLSVLYFLWLCLTLARKFGQSMS